MSYISHEETLHVKLMTRPTPEILRKTTWEDSHGEGEEYSSKQRGAQVDRTKLRVIELACSVVYDN